MKTEVDRNATQTVAPETRHHPADSPVVIEFLEHIVDLLEQKGILTRQEVQQSLMRRYLAKDPKGGAQPGDTAGIPPGSGSPKQPFRMRSAPRFEVRCRIMFSSGQFQGEGTICDLSTNGCKVSCGVLVEPGMQLALSLFLPDDRRPLVVDRAEVRWAKGQEFGLEFLELGPAERNRLRTFLPSPTEGVPH